MTEPRRVKRPLKSRPLCRNHSAVAVLDALCERGDIDKWEHAGSTGFLDGFRLHLDGRSTEVEFDVFELIIDPSYLLRSLTTAIKLLREPTCTSPSPT